MENLISSVENNPVLYDTTHPDYMRTKKKNQIWEKIAVELKMENGQKAKDQWTKLRDCHRDALRRQGKRKSETPESVIRPWTYQQQMEFLLPFMTNRTTHSNVPCDSERLSIDHEPNADHELPADEESNTMDITLNPSSFSVPSMKIKKTTITGELGNKLKKEDRAIRREKLRGRIVKKGEVEVPEQNDALHQFFMSMYNLTKLMPMRYQQEIRKKLFAAVSSAEDEIFAHSSSAQQWSSSTSNAGSEMADTYPTYFLASTTLIDDDEEETAQDNSD